MRVGSRNPACQHDGLIMLIFILVEEVQILYINDLLEFSTAAFSLKCVLDRKYVLPSTYVDNLIK